MDNLATLHKLLIDFNVSINQSTDIVRLAAINDQLTHAKELSESRLIELNKRMDIARKTYIRWCEKKAIISGLANDLLREGMVPNRQEFIRINELLDRVIVQFDQLPDVYGDEWKLFGIDKKFIAAGLTASESIGILKARLNKIGIDYYPDLMY